MLSLETESRLLRYVQDVAEQERQIENLRQILAENVDFEPYTTFKRLDRASKGYLREYDLQDFLADNHIIITSSESYTLLKILDKDGNGRISYSEFSHAILPQNNNTWKNIALSRSSYYVGPNDLLAHDLEYTLSRVLEKELQSHKDNEVSKSLLNDRYDWSTRSSFRTVDTDNLGSIDYTSLKIFYNKNGQVGYADELDAALRRLDQDGDGRVSYSEWISATLPSGSRATLRSPSRLMDDSYRSPSRVYSPSRGTYTSPRRTTTRSFSPARSTRYASPSRLSPSKLRTSSPSRYTSPFKSTQKEESFSTPQKESRGRQMSSPSRGRAQSPLKVTDESELVNSFKEQIRLDRDLEGIKQDLSLRSDFNMEDVWAVFDVSRKGYLTSFDLEEGLRVNGVYPTQDELNLVMRRYDEDGDGRLSYTEWGHLVVPKSLEYSSILKKRLPHNSDGYYARDNVFEFETKMQLKKLLTAHLDFERAAERLRQSLRRRPEFNIYDAFKTVDKDDNGFITMDEFREVLRSWGFYASFKELETLMDRYDSNKDGKITYSEFHNEVAPKSPVRY